MIELEQLHVDRSEILLSNGLNGWNSWNDWNHLSRMAVVATKPARYSALS